MDPADFCKMLCSVLSYSCTQRTGKASARLLLLSGFTPEPWKYKSDPYTLDAESGVLLQA